jgi:hypothetical protein
MAEHTRQSESRIAGWLNGDAPWWARLLIFAIANILFPIVIVATFMAQDTGYLPSVSRSTNATVLLMERQIAESRLSDKAACHLLVAICRNTAANEAQRTECNRLMENSIR